MRDLQRQTLDWIDRAPLSAFGRAVSAASPDAVFAVLADHVRWPEWFPGVKRIEVIGAASGVGARRRVHIPGAVVEEEFIAWDPGVRWSFTATASTPRFARSLVEDCRLEATPDGGTAISYGMHLQLAPLLSPIGPLLRRSLSKNLATAMQQLAARAVAPPS